MKDLILNSDRSVNWKFIVLLPLGTFISALLYTLASWDTFINPPSYFQRTTEQQALLIFMGHGIFLLGLWLWAWFGYKKPILAVPVLNALVVGLGAGLVMEILRTLGYSIILMKDLSAFNESEHISLSAINIGDWVLLLIFVAVFDHRFKNKLLLYFLMVMAAGVITSPLYDLADKILRFHPNSILVVLLGTLILGLITASLFRFFKVRVHYPETRTMEIRHAIVRKLKTGSQKSEAWEELKDTFPDVSHAELAKIFTTVSELSDDVGKFNISQCYLITITLLSCYQLFPFLLSLHQRNFNGDVFSMGYDDLIGVCMRGLLLLKFYLVYEYIYHRAFAYRLTITIAVLLALGSLVAVISTGWISLVNALLHLIAAWVAYRICSDFFPNYRIFYQPAINPADKL